MSDEEMLANLLQEMIIPMHLWRIMHVVQDSTLTDLGDVITSLQIMLLHGIMYQLDDVIVKTVLLQSMVHITIETNFYYSF